VYGQCNKCKLVCKTPLFFGKSEKEESRKV